MKRFKWHDLQARASVVPIDWKAVFLNADGFKERRQVRAGQKGQARKQCATIAHVNWKNKNPGDICSGQN
jgi:hypothetical protein